MPTEKPYVSVAGIVQFDPQERTINKGKRDEKKVWDVTIRSFRSQKPVKITVFPNHHHLNIQRYDFLAADGPMDRYQPKTQGAQPVTSVAALRLVHIPQAPEKQPEEEAVHLSYEEEVDGGLVI